MRRGEGFIMRSVDEYENARRLADPARAIRRRMSGLQMAILRFLDEEGSTPYREVRQALIGEDRPITPSWKASFSRSVGGLIDKQFVIRTHEAGEVYLQQHPAWAEYMKTLKSR